MNKNRKKPINGRSHKEEQKMSAPLEQRLLESLVEPLRSTSRRAKSLADTHASQEAIEQALASPAVLSGIAKAQNAFVVEQWPALLAKLFIAAEKRQAWAWRILLDIAGVADQLRAASGDMAEEPGVEEETALPKEIRALLSRADEEAEIPDSAAPAE